MVLNNDEIAINIKTPFLWEQKNLFELFCIETDFAKYFAKCRNLFKYFVSHITVTPRNFLYHRPNQISLK